MNKDIDLSSVKYPVSLARRCTVRKDTPALQYLWKNVTMNDDTQVYTVTRVKLSRHRALDPKVQEMYLLLADTGETYYVADRNNIVLVDTSAVTLINVTEYFSLLQPLGFYVPPFMYNALIPTLVEKCKSAIDPMQEITTFIHWVPDRRVVAAANLVTHESLPKGTLIIPSARHYDPVMHALYDALLISRKHDTDILPQHSQQGFIDQWGGWMNRVDALAVVKHCGQPFDAQRNGSGTELFSEGVW